MRGTYWILILVAALGWGSGGITTRAAFAEGVGIWTMVGLRVAIAALLVLAVLVARRSPLPTVAVLRYGLSQAVFNLTVPYVLFTYALDSASAGFVGLLTALIPLSTSIFANFMLEDESMTPRKFFALLVGFTGVAALMLSGDSGLQEGGRPLVAIGLGLTSVVSVGYAGAFAKKHAGSYDPIMLSGIQFGFAAIWLVAAMFDIPVTNASLVGYIVPFVALIGGIVLLDEQLQSGIVVGGVLVAAGMFLSDRESRRISSPVTYQSTPLN